MGSRPRLIVQVICWLCGALVVGVLVGRFAPTPARSQSVGIPRAFLPVIMKAGTPVPPAAPRPTNTPGPTATIPTTTPLPADTIRNGDFEDGAVGWTQQSTQGNDAIVPAWSAPVAAHGGTWLAWLGGAADETTSLSQRLVLSTDRRYLTYWVYIASDDACGYDTGFVTVGYDDLTEQVEGYWLCDQTSTTGWVRHVVDLQPYAGRTVDLIISATVDGSINSNMFVDDVALSPSAE